MEKVQWNSIDKKQNVLKYSKNDKSSTHPRFTKCIFNIKVGTKNGRPVQSSEATPKKIK